MAVTAPILRVRGLEPEDLKNHAIRVLRGLLKEYGLDTRRPIRVHKSPEGRATG
jgi:hypothetical protein